MKIKKISALFVLALTLLSSTAYAQESFEELYAKGEYITDQSEEELIKVLREVYEHTGNIPAAVKGNIVFNSELANKKNNFEKEDAAEKNISDTFSLSNFEITDQSEEEIMSVLQEIYDNTGAIPESVKASRIYVKSEEELMENNKLMMPQATSAPTKLMPGKEFTADWSGTINYTYTQYLTPDYIGGSAATDYYVNYYDSNGNYLFTTNPTRNGDSDWTYVTGTSFRGKYGNVYAIFYNKASTSSKLAVYTLQNN